MKGTEQREKKIDTLSSLLLSKLEPFLKHPFKPYNGEKMLELADSIKEGSGAINLELQYEVFSGDNCVPRNIYERLFAPEPKPIPIGFFGVLRGVFLVVVWEMYFAVFGLFSESNVF